MYEGPRCVIAGAGPGGSMLALLLARRGVPVTLLEMHKDFDREFRGDTVHPSTLEILDQLGLAEKVHQIAHSKVYGPSFMTSKGLFQPVLVQIVQCIVYNPRRNFRILNEDMMNELWQTGSAGTGAGWPPTIALGRHDCVTRAG